MFTIDFAPIKPPKRGNGLLEGTMFLADRSEIVQSRDTTYVCVRGGVGGKVGCDDISGCSGSV